VLEKCVPWPADLAELYRRKGYWQGQTLGEFPWEWADQHGDREAIVLGEERVSYAELAERSDCLAIHLRRLGIGRQDRVVVQLPNMPEFLYLSFALFKLGALPVFALPAHRDYEITYLIEFSHAVAYAIPATFRDFDYVKMAERIKSQLPSLKHILVVGEENRESLLNLGKLARDETVDVQSARGELTEDLPDSSEVALFLLSGGTTGLPKLIPRTHDDYAYNARASAQLCKMRSDTIYLVTLPIGHNFPLACPGILGTLFAGGRVVLSLSPQAEIIFPIVERERVNITAVVPALAIRWMDSPLRGSHDLSSLKVLQVGGARLNPEAARRVRPALGCLLQQVFGMAEGLLNYTRLDDPEEVMTETQGRPLSPDDEISVVDETDQPVALGEPGELLTRGPYTIRGYYHAEETNRNSFTNDGFYRTGDIVRVHSSGNLVVEGRLKDLINRGGEKVSAEEIENLILAHPKVLNVAVVAMPDPVLGERSCAYVITRGEAKLTLAELVDFLRTRRIAKFKLPERLELLERFPLTSVGKISKKQLREEIAEKLRAEHVS